MKRNPLIGWFPNIPILWSGKKSSSLMSLPQRLIKRSSANPAYPTLPNCVAVACILTDMGMDAASVCAGLLHDVVEDTDITVEEISARFGPDIALMVDGVTKLPSWNAVPRRNVR